MSVVAANIANIRSRIAVACAGCARPPANVTLVAVSKRQPSTRIAEALAAGQRVFGENHVQEAKARWMELRASYPDLRLHLIGPLQTNKAREAVSLFDCIETLDRPALAEALAREMRKQGRSIPCFIQINTGAESQKSGADPEALPGLLDHARSLGLSVTGLMCIPPIDEPPALHFALLKKLARRYQLQNLSMGMSGDFEEAVALGATHVRIGTALFGDREEA